MEQDTAGARKKGRKKRRGEVSPPAPKRRSACLSASPLNGGATLRVPHAPVTPPPSPAPPAAVPGTDGKPGRLLVRALPGTAALFCLWMSLAALGLYCFGGVRGFTSATQFFLLRFIAALGFLAAFYAVLACLVSGFRRRPAGAAGFALAAAAGGLLGTGAMFVLAAAAGTGG